MRGIGSYYLTLSHSENQA